jgi:hypothetical protein
MAVVAAFLLVVMGPAREEDAFWTLLALTHDRLPRSCVVEVRARALHLPNLATHHHRCLATLAQTGHGSLLSRVSPVHVDASWAPPAP